MWSNKNIDIKLNLAKRFINNSKSLLNTDKDDELYKYTLNFSYYIYYTLVNLNKTFTNELLEKSEDAILQAKNSLNKLRDKYLQYNLEKTVILGNTNNDLSPYNKIITYYEQVISIYDDFVDGINEIEENIIKNNISLLTDNDSVCTNGMDYQEQQEYVDSIFKSKYENPHLLQIESDIESEYSFHSVKQEADSNLHREESPALTNISYASCIHIYNSPEKKSEHIRFKTPPILDVETEGDSERSNLSFARPK